MTDIQQPSEPQGDAARLKAAFMKVAAPAWQKFKTLVYETPIEVGIGAALFMGTALGLSVKHEAAKEGSMPVAFSEIEDIQHTFGGRGQAVPPLTAFYAKTNDVVMKVHEANNLAYDNGGDHEAYATQLERKVEMTFRVHALISDYAKEFPATSDSALARLNKMLDAIEDPPPIVKAFDNAWDEEHDDVYRTETYTDTQCDADGKNCQTVIKTRQVYDHTDHTYTYHKKYGDQAAALLNTFAVKHPDVSVAEKLFTSPKTEAENEWAMRRAFRSAFKDKDKEMKVEDYLEYSHLWASGSSFSTFYPQVLKHHQNLRGGAPVWDRARLTAKSDSYSTGSSHDAGPTELQIAKATSGEATSMFNAVTGISSGMTYARTAIPQLEKTIWKYVNVVLHGDKDGDKAALRKEINEITKNLYEKNYAKGFDVEPFKIGNVLLWSLLGALAGAGVGYAADRYIDARRRRREGEGFKDDIDRLLGRRPAVDDYMRRHFGR